MTGRARSISRRTNLATLWLLLVCACVTPFALGARPDPETDATYQRFVTIAGEPQDSVRFFRVHYWQPINERALVLWLGREEPYLIDLRERCHGLKQELFLRIADYQRPGRNMLRARWSSIVTRNGLPCRIGAIRALDFSRIGEVAPREIGPDGRREVGAATPDTPIPASGGERQWAALVSVRMEPPEYPKNAARRNKHGVTHVAAEVSPDGSVRRTEVLISSGHHDLDSAALRAVRRWQFEPYRNDDPARLVWVQVPVVFGPDS